MKKTKKTELKSNELKKLKESLSLNFKNITDPRIDRTKSHKLIDIIGITLLAVIGGASGWVAIETYGKNKEEWLKNLFELKNGIPSHDTFSRVWSRLDPEEVKNSLEAWVKSLLEKLDIHVVSIDGKTVKSSYDREKGQKAIQLVQVWNQEHKLLLGQEKVNSKSNEITAIPQLLEALDLKGTIITIDAMGTQKEIAKKIVQKEAKYVLALKKDQKNMYENVEKVFKEKSSLEIEEFVKVSAGHHRVEKRKIETITAKKIPKKLREQWSGIETLIRVEREQKKWNKIHHQVCYYISNAKENAEYFAEIIRDHWGIENTLHWTLDVTFKEDESRIRRDNSPENIAIVRRFALNLLNQEKTFKGSNAMKRYSAALNNNYMLTILQYLIH